MVLLIHSSSTVPVRLPAARRSRLKNIEGTVRAQYDPPYTGRSERLMDKGGISIVRCFLFRLGALLRATINIVVDHGELEAAEAVQLPVPEHQRELGMVDAQMPYHVCLLVVRHRAVRTLEAGRLPALITQMRQHRFLPFVEIVAARALVHPVPPDDHELAAGTAVEPLDPGHLLRGLKRSCCP